VTASAAERVRSPVHVGAVRAERARARAGGQHCRTSGPARLAGPTKSVPRAERYGALRRWSALSQPGPAACGTYKKVPQPSGTSTAGKRTVAAQVPPARGPQKSAMSRAARAPVVSTAAAQVPLGCGPTNRCREPNGTSTAVVSTVDLRSRSARGPTGAASRGMSNVGGRHCRTSGPLPAGPQKERTCGFLHCETG
jgi:hypothetical protein